MRTQRAAPLLLAVLVCALLPRALAKKKKSKAPAADVAPAEEQKKDKHNDPDSAHLTYGNNPLHDAARLNDHVFLKRILDRVPGTFADRKYDKWEYDDPEDFPDIHDYNDAKNTALHLATWTEAVDAVRLLLQAGANVHGRNRAGNTPIHWAARATDTTILELLLEHGADPTATCENGFTALHFCAFTNAVDSCKILLDRGGDVNAVNVKGYAAIHTASEHHQTDVAELLMSRGADVKLQDENGNGPLDLASGRAATAKYDALPHQVKLIETLRAKGAFYAEERKNKAAEQTRNAEARQRKAAADAAKAAKAGQAGQGEEEAGEEARAGEE